MSIRINDGPLRARLALLQGILAAPLATTAAGSEAAALLTAALQAGAPRRTGQYAAALHAESEGGDTALTVTGYGPDPLSTWITEGTAPHAILPRFARALFWPGAAHPVMRVAHPGTRPNPFARQAAEAVAPTIAQRVAAVLSQELASG